MDLIIMLLRGKIPKSPTTRLDNYTKIASQRTDTEIYTLGGLNFKVYITNSTRLFWA